jgi:pantoate kinase
MHSWICIHFFLDTRPQFQDNQVKDTIMEATAFSPGHITGFFTIEDSSPNIAHTGSRGAGVSLGYGVTTTVRAHRSTAGALSVYFNGVKTENAVVSRRVFAIFFQKAGISPLFDVMIRHTISIPMGSGCGSSGAGALGCAFALNKAFQTGFTPTECAQIAHQAEVEMKTGLGTVIGETFGGIEIRIQPGAPGVGEIRQIPCDPSYRVIVLMFGPLSTKEFLGNRKIRENINLFGKSLVEKICISPTIPDFLRFSREFAEKTGLVTKKAAEVFSLCDKAGYVMCMPMFGDGVFTIAGEKQTDEICHILEPYKKDAACMICDIDMKGARVLYGN